MAPDGDPDEALLVDWRADSSYAEKLIVAPRPKQHQPSLLPFKQKKATLIGDTATRSKMARIADTTADCMIVVKSESRLKSSGGGDGHRIATPVVYDLSDSDGTPLRCRAPVRRPAEGPAAMVKPVCCKHKANPEILLIDSDSDEEVSPTTTFKSPVYVEKLRQPRTQGGSHGQHELQKLEPSGKVDMGRDLVSQEGLLERPISLDEAGMVDSGTEAVSLGCLSRKEFSLDSKRMVDTIFCGTAVQVALEEVTAYVADLPIRFEDDSQKAGPSSVLGSKPNEMRDGNVGGSDMLPDCAAEVPKTMMAPAVEATRDCSLGSGLTCAGGEENRMSTPFWRVHELSSDDDGCGSEPEGLRHDEKRISTMGSPISEESPPHNCEDGEQFQPNFGGTCKVNDCSAGEETPLRNRPAFASHEDSREKKRRSCPVQAAILSLSSDDDGCGSEPSWLRNYQTVRSSLNVGVSSAHEYRCQGIHDQGLRASVGNIEVGDLSSARRRPSVQVSCVESPEKWETSISPNVNDLDSAEDAPQRKRGRARKLPVSEDELAAREAQKQRQRELKKARQQAEKRIREEKREELKRQKEASKVDAAEKRRLEKESEKWRKGKFALQNTIVYIHNSVIEMNPLGSLVIAALNAKNYAYKCEERPIKNTIIWRTRRPSANAQVDRGGLGSQGGGVISSQPSSSQVALEDVEIEYVVVVYQGEDFAKLVAEKGYEADLSTIRKQYPSYSICFLICGLKKYLRKMEQKQYKTGDQSWTRPNVEQVLAELITHHQAFNFRLCIDESEIADHVAGLTRSLAECPFKKKITSVSVHANGEHVKRADPNNYIVRKSTWLKFLVAIDGVNGSIAIAVAKEYPTMRALLQAYLDPCRAVHDKEKLLEDLVKDTADRNRIGPAVSRRIYRVMMAKDGNLSIKEVDEGADHFT